MSLGVRRFASYGADREGGLGQRISRPGLNSSADDVQKTFE
ncbi:hypothetical protein SAMN05216522_10962 [Rosenbergiella nectarea]|uniref:Uncharacterized protein n=1 Tax=Rosenbergiella nectarea TaxID=988801 RepID=A0A1H9KBU7_9GAMM|nr:hypothetical protein [Rosenbergiella nectarea]SEQ96676.1 hypothetical protein SAMN05216522_10962 [Rosenbergiella nectarea]